jgi:hypothetical protein
MTVKDVKPISQLIFKKKQWRAHLNSLEKFARTSEGGK